jgi:hypothetical protein
VSALCLYPVDLLCKFHTLNLVSANAQTLVLVTPVESAMSPCALPVCKFTLRWASVDSILTTAD